jgi:hypothetical protein
VTDGDAEQLRDFVDEFKPLTSFHQRRTACSDLLVAAHADLLVCSISSFSMWAAFLSNAPYIWFLPHLQNADGCYSIWGNEPQQQAPDGVTFSNAVRVGAKTRLSDLLPRGVPVGSSGTVPPILLKQLEMRLRQKALATDLVSYGVVPSKLLDPAKDIDQQFGTPVRVNTRRE